MPGSRWLNQRSRHCLPIRPPSCCASPTTTFARPADTISFTMLSSSSSRPLRELRGAAPCSSGAGTARRCASSSRPRSSSSSWRRASRRARRAVLSASTCRRARPCAAGAASPRAAGLHQLRLDERAVVVLRVVDLLELGARARRQRRDAARDAAEPGAGGGTRARPRAPGSGRVPRSAASARSGKPPSSRGVRGGGARRRCRGRWERRLAGRATARARRDRHESARARVESLGGGWGEGGEREREGAGGRAVDGQLAISERDPRAAAPRPEPLVACPRRCRIFCSSVGEMRVSALERREVRPGCSSSCVELLPRLPAGRTRHGARRADLTGARSRRLPRARCRASRARACTCSPDWSSRYSTPPPLGRRRAAGATSFARPVAQRGATLSPRRRARPPMTISATRRPRRHGMTRAISHAEARWVSPSGRTGPRWAWSNSSPQP